jgi:hypothetical protein
MEQTFYGVGIEAAACPLLQQHFGVEREALARDALLTRQLVELPGVVQIRHVEDGVHAGGVERLARSGLHLAEADHGGLIAPEHLRPQLVDDLLHPAGIGHYGPVRDALVRIGHRDSFHIGSHWRDLEPASAPVPLPFGLRLGSAAQTSCAC